MVGWLSLAYTCELKYSYSHVPSFCDPKVLEYKVIFKWKNAIWSNVQRE